MLKKLYRELFYVPKYGKVHDKVLLNRIGLSAATIVLCLMAMSISAYAFFSHHVNSSVQSIRAATYDLNVIPPEGATPDSAGYYTLDNSMNPEAAAFTFRLVKSEASTASVGYCKVEVKTSYNPDSNQAGYSQFFYTEPIGTFVQKDAGGQLIQGAAPITDDERDVTITVQRGEIAVVRFVAAWGTCTKTPVIEEGAGIVPQFGPLRDLAEICPVTPEETPPAETLPQTDELQPTQPEQPPEETQPTEAAADPQPTEPALDAQENDLSTQPSTEPDGEEEA